MRVIAGKAKGRRLKMVPGQSTRPILDRVKENLFNILGPWVAGSRWWDLFAGTGQVGIEALSRGAAYVLFTEINGLALGTIQENLRITRLSENAEVRREDALAMLTRDPEDAFEVIFIAPPQYQDMWSRTLHLVDRQPGWLLPDGLVIVQIDPNEYTPPDLAHLELYDDRTYGSTQLLFYERPSE